MQQILILSGLPASGKSTWAKALVKESKDRWKIVNKDYLRLMLSDGQRTNKTENFVIHVRDEIIREALSQGYNVIVDDTNFNPQHEKRIKLIAEENGANVEVKFFDTPVEECTKRDLARSNSVGAEVIQRMYNQYLFKPKEYNPDLNLPLACLVDIDGTLAKNVCRGFYNWGEVKKDKVHEHTALVVKALKAQGVKIIILSGRDSYCKDITEEWLAENGIQYDELYMRPEGNKEHDEIIKERIYHEHIEGRFRVALVLDDRGKVIRMWKRLGLPVLDCNQDCYKVEF